jgi:hypothetical protein
MMTLLVLIGVGLVAYFLTRKNSDSNPPLHQESKSPLPLEIKKKTAVTSRQKSTGDGIVINSGDNFELTLYNAPSNIIKQVEVIISDDQEWKKENLLMPLFAQ